MKPNRLPNIRHKLQISHLEIQRLQPARQNARRHGEKQIHQIAASIREFGFTAPILVDEAHTIIAGHGRFAAAKLLNLATVPTIQLTGLSPAQKQALAIADNRLAELATWDPPVLQAEINALLTEDLEIDLLGFDTADLDRILMVTPETGNDNAEAPVMLPEPGGPARSRPGDVWQLGRHRLICGDARNMADYATLLGDEKAEMVFTDPPYNVKIQGHVTSSSRLRHREFVMASGEMSQDQFTEFLRQFMTNARAFSIDGSVHFITMDWRHLREVLAAGEAAYSRLLNLCVWAKDNGGMGSFYRSQHELILVFKAGGRPHINNFGLGQKGRYRTNLWSYAGVNTFRAGRMEDLEVHPTVKPLALVRDAILDCSKRGGIILDPFVGSGTTILAAEVTGRTCRAMELDPLYVDASIRRWQERTGAKAVHAATGEQFDVRLSGEAGAALAGSRSPARKAGR